MTKYPIPVVRVLLKNSQNELLFLKRNSSNGYNQWAFPGGKVEIGQTIEKTCIDELKQDTNLDIFKIRPLFFHEDLSQVEGNLHWLVFYFRASYKGNLKINDESFDARWLNKTDLNHYEIAFNHQDVAEKYFNKEFPSQYFWK